MTSSKSQFIIPLIPFFCFLILLPILILRNNNAGQYRIAAQSSNTTTSSVTCGCDGPNRGGISCTKMSQSVCIQNKGHGCVWKGACSVPKPTQTGCPPNDPNCRPEPTPKPTQAGCPPTDPNCRPEPSPDSQPACDTADPSCQQARKKSKAEAWCQTSCVTTKVGDSQDEATSECKTKEYRECVHRACGLIDTPQSTCNISYTKKGTTGEVTVNVKPQLQRQAIDPFINIYFPQGYEIVEGTIKTNQPDTFQYTNYGNSINFDNYKLQSGTWTATFTIKTNPISEGVVSATTFIDLNQLTCAKDSKIYFDQTSCSQKL